MLIHCFIFWSFSTLELKLLQQWQSQEMFVTNRSNFPQSEIIYGFLCKSFRAWITWCFRDVSWPAQSPDLSVPNKLLREYLNSHTYHIWPYTTEDSARNMYVKLIANSCRNAPKCHDTLYVRNVLLLSVLINK